jgi:hypothetical protein
MSAPARWELWKATPAHYRSAPRASKGRILDEFCRATGYHRKYALRLFNGAPPGVVRPRRRRWPATYSAAMSCSSNNLDGATIPPFGNFLRWLDRAARSARLRARPAGDSVARTVETEGEEAV